MTKIRGSRFGPTTRLSAPPPPLAIFDIVGPSASSPTAIVEILIPSAAMLSASDGSTSLFCDRPSESTMMCLVSALAARNWFAATSSAGGTLVPPSGSMPWINAALRSGWLLADSGISTSGSLLNITTPTRSVLSSDRTAAAAPSLAIACLLRREPPTRKPIDPEQSITIITAAAGLTSRSGSSSLTGRIGSTGVPRHPPAPSESGPPIITSPPPCCVT